MSEISTTVTHGGVTYKVWIAGNRKEAVVVPQNDKSPG